MLPPVSITDFCFDPAMLGRWFAGPSWENWRIVLRAAFGEKLTPREHLRFVELADREPPGHRLRELWLAIGRRGGKDSVASAIATYIASLSDFTPLLRAGERATVLCLAVDRVQSRIVHGYIAGYFEQVPLLHPLVRRITDDTIELKNGVDIVIATNSFRAIRGRTVAAAILDENAYWLQESDTSNSDVEVYAALSPGLVTLREAGSMIIGISTVYKRSGLLYERWRNFHGTEDPDVLVICQPSHVFHPSDDIIREYERAVELDPERANAEWMSVWRSDLADFVDRAVVDAAIPPGCFELPYNSRYTYVGFTDPSGGSADSFTLAIAHSEKDRAALDCVREVRPPFSPESVCEEFAATLHSYHLSRVIGDRYAGEWPREQFAKRGVIYEPSERSKSDIYRELLPILNAKRCDLLDNPRLVSQLCSLERRTARGGRESIDHPPGGKDDLANAVAGALTILVSDDRSAVVRRYLLGRAA